MNEKNIKEIIEQKGLTFGRLTVSECVAIARDAGAKVSDVVILEAMEINGMTRDAVLDSVLDSFAHNFTAINEGITTGSSFIMGHVGNELSAENAKPLFEDKFINKILTYTFSAQIGNHCVGLEPCAGTGDSCPYTGFVKAMLEEYPREKVAEAASVMLKVGTLFRVGKLSTGCNMEGYGAGSAATAAAFAELESGSPDQLEKAIVLAISPTIGVPCTPRVMVPGLCATHIGGAIINGRLSSGLAMNTTLPVNVTADVMIAMAAKIHMVAAKSITPTVIQYMEPFFKTNAEVESYIDPEIKSEEKKRIENIIQQAGEEARALAEKANSIVKPFGMAVVGGSSQAVGSPTNAGRLVNALAQDGTKVKKVRIELYPELFARRGINVPGILMGAVFGSKTSDALMYREVMDKVKELGIEVEILQVEEPQVQKITVVTEKDTYMVKTLNRGGARLVLVDAVPGRDAAEAAAKNLGIELVL